MGGSAISDRDQLDGFDFDRLERAVTALAEAHRAQLEENAQLRRKLEERTGRIRTLEEQVREGNQRRQEVIKRVDELIAQIDQLDSQLGTIES